MKGRSSYVVKALRTPGEKFCHLEVYLKFRGVGSPAPHEKDFMLGKQNRGLDLLFVLGFA